MNTKSQRRIARTTTAPAHTPGFAGQGHFAAMVLTPADFAMSDPFLILADDKLDFTPGQQVGEPHPHAGLETVTLLVEGGITDHDAGTFNQGDVEWMSAGRGVVHNENVIAHGKSRILQLWVVLPKSARDSRPALQAIHADKIPVRRDADVELRLYSGTSADLTSPTRNNVPVTMAEIRLKTNATVEQDLPASYNAFLYMLEGSVHVGDAEIRTGQTGWLDRPQGTEPGSLQITAGTTGARLVLYAGLPQNEPVVAHGPFVADSQENIARLFSDYRAGKFEHLSEVIRTAAAA
jgi:redox-sensitive bicupin YhaK (pirin superfamily)